VTPDMATVNALASQIVEILGLTEESVPKWLRDLQERLEGLMAAGTTMIPPRERNRPRNSRERTRNCPTGDSMPAQRGSHGEPQVPHRAQAAHPNPQIPRPAFT
jgi:hypothetical protein